MDESMAWLYQAMADREAAERFVANKGGTGRCHAIAKWQQTVEKAVKALVSALHGAGILNVRFRPRHEVERYIGMLVRLPHSPDNRTIQQLLHGLLDQSTRAGIRAVDGLAPMLPTRRNAEYPFQDAHGQWTYPAAEGTFSSQEAQDFRALAHRIVDGSGRIISALRRRPR